MNRHQPRFLSAVAVLAAAFGAVSVGEPVAAQVDAGFGTAAASAPGAWQANDDDFLFLQLVIKNYKLTYDVRGYRTDRGVCLDLADVIQSLDMPIRIDKKSRRATGWLFNEEQTFTLDREAETVQNVNNAAAPVASEIYDTPEGWCVNVGALSTWFGLEFKPDLYNAVVRIETETPLPFMQALERKSRAARLKSKPKAFDLSKFPSADMEYKPWRTPSLDVVAQAGYQTNGSGTTASQTTAKVELYAAGEALGASYFARLATDNGLAPQALRFRAYRNDPDGTLLGPLQATQVAIGDVETPAGQLTGQSAVGRGIFVTNRPIGRSSRFSTTELRGVMPAGWDAELYRNGQLIAFQEDNGDGRYEFLDVELFFGRNELEVVLYGPQGQIRRERADYPVGLNQVEPGKTYYWAGVLQANRDLIEITEPVAQRAQEWRWGVGVERGLDDRTSASLGLQSIYLNSARRYYAEGAVVRSFGRVQAELAGGYELGGGGVATLNAAGRFGRFNLGFRGLKTLGNFTSEMVSRDIDYRLGINVDTSIKLGSLTLPVQGRVDHSSLKTGAKVNNFLITTSVNAGRLAVSAQFDHQIERGNPEQPDRSDSKLRLLANMRVKDLRFRGNASFDLDEGFETAKVTVDKSLTDRSDINGELEYLATADEFRLSVGYTHRFDKLSLRGEGFATSRGGFGANVAVAFSLGPDPVSGGIRFSETKLARTGQAAVTVFRDDNGNGRRDPEEQFLEDVTVAAGLRSTDAVTAENGRTIVDGLRPFKPILVGIDEASLGDPFLAPSVKGVVVTPRPGIVAEVELPISPSGEVEGILLNTKGLEQPGVVLQLINRAGRLASETISEFDGFFLFERVPYGEYRLRVAVDSAKALQVQPELRGALTVNRDDDIVRLGPTKLQPGSLNIAAASAASP